MEPSLHLGMESSGGGYPATLGVSPFVSTIVLSFRKPDSFFRGSGGFLERRIPGKNGGGAPRIVSQFSFQRGPLVRPVHGTKSAKRGPSSMLIWGKVSCHRISGPPVLAAAKELEARRMRSDGAADR